MKQCNCNTPNLKPKCKEVGGITIVVIPAELGDSSNGSLYAPATCEYKNTLVKYLADGLVYLYDKDGNWTLVADSDAVEPTIDQELDISSDNPVANRAITRAVNELTAAITAEAQTRADEDADIRADLAEEIEKETEDIRQVQAELNRDFVNDLEMETSATNVTFKEDKINPFTGATSQEVDTIPSASATTAGTISASEYLSIKSSQDRLDALEGGSVAISGLSTNPSQSDLTNAWLTETGESALINRASIYDITNTKVWTYYDNTQTWYEVTAGTISVNPFTNSTAGTILGSTTDGNVSANIDGTGTVSGWSTLSNQVSTNTSNIALKANITDLPTIDSTLSDSSTNPVENQAIANEFEKVAYANGPAVSPSSTAFVDTQNIVNNAVTTAKIANGSVTSDKIDWATIGSSGKIDLGNTLIQWGQENAPAGGVNTWTDAIFATSFASTPALSATIITPAGTESNAMISPRIGSLTSTGFRWAVTYSGGFGSNQTISWIAIGPKS